MSADSQKHFPQAGVDWGRPLSLFKQHPIQHAWTGRSTHGICGAFNIVIGAFLLLVSYMMVASGFLLLIYGLVGTDASNLADVRAEWC